MDSQPEDQTNNSQGKKTYFYQISFYQLSYWQTIFCMICLLKFSTICLAEIENQSAATSSTIPGNLVTLSNGGANNPSPSTNPEYAPSTFFYDRHPVSVLIFAI
jgi:hypothetical protein